MNRADDIMNKYLISSVIVFGGFIILSVMIYTSNTFNIQENLIVESMVYDFNSTSSQSHAILYSPTLTQLMKLSSDYGREYFWIVILVLMLLIGGIDGRVVGLMILFSFIIIIPLNTIIKDLIDKDRPLVYGNRLIENFPRDKSYPSGHASMVSSGALSIVLFYRKSLNQKIVSFSVIIEAGLVCFSRLYLGVHYPSDVLGGILLGSGVSLLVASNQKVLKRLTRRLI